MRVGLRYICHEISPVFERIIAVKCHGTQIGSSGPCLDHVGDCLFQQFRLCRNTDNKGTRFNQTDRPVLKLSRRIRLGVDIGDLFHLEASFHCDCVVKSASDHESIRSVGKLAGKPLNALFIFDNFFNFIRDRNEIRKQCLHLLISDSAQHLSKSDGQQISGNKLTGVGLCRCHGYLGPCQSVEHIVCFTGNAGADYIDDGKRFYTGFFCFAQRCQCIGCLSGLADNHHKIIRSQAHLPVPEFGGKLCSDGYLSKILHHVLST